MLNVLQGGSFGSGFATGAVASLAGSAVKWGGFSPSEVVGATTIAGAGTSALTGSNWMDGAMAGMSIGMFNHEGEKLLLANGTYATASFDDVVCTANRINKSSWFIARMVYSARMMNNYRSHGKLTLYNGRGNVIGDYNASSGSGGGKSTARTLPAGNYEAHGFSLTNDSRFMNDGVGFKINLNPEKVWDTSLDRFRSALEIHPAKLGTLGCIGLNEDASQLLDFKNKWLNTIRINKVVPVSVVYY